MPQAARPTEDQPSALVPEDFRWEDPPATQRVPGKHARILEAVLMLREQPGRWAHLHRYGTPSSATTAKTRLERRAWAAVYEFTVRGRSLYGRMRGDS